MMMSIGDFLVHWICLLNYWD